MAAGDVLHGLHVARAARCGALPGPTTDHWRVDYVWVNAPAREAVTDFSVEDIFATHRSFRIRLHLAAFPQQKPMRYKPAPLDTTPRISLSADAILNIFSRHSEQWAEQLIFYFISFFFFFTIFPFKKRKRKKKQEKKKEQEKENKKKTKTKEKKQTKKKEKKEETKRKKEKEEKTKEKRKNEKKSQTKEKRHRSSKKFKS